MTLNGGVPIKGADLRVVMNSSPQLYTGGIKVNILLGESLLEDREEGRGLSVGYRRQGDNIQNGLFPDTSKPPKSVSCTHFSDNPGTLFLSGSVCKTPSLDLIDFTA